MYKERYSITEIERIVAFADDGSESYTDESDVGEAKLGDISAALQAIENGCWDTLDWNHDAVILYPADSHQNIRTGAYESTQVVIAGSERAIHWLGNIYYGRKRVHST